MPALIQFVDSISATPTVRLDINDATAWFCQNFSAPPPRLRRSESSNSMRDGGVVSASSYENRTLEVELTLVNASTEDAAATEMQKLWRELDRPTNYLRYQREGMTKPVFFRLFRSDAADLEELWTTPIARNITLELVAEPFALGLRESLGPYTVTNDPAAGSNGCYFDVTGVIGDVRAPVIVHDASRTVGHGILASRSRGTPSDLVWFKQLEGTNVVLGTDTTNPGGGPDATMSGTGTNNYVRTSFTTNATMVARVEWQAFNELTTSAQRLAIRGMYRMVVVVRRSDSTSDINIKLQTGVSTVVPKTTARQMVDVGIVHIGTRQGTSVGYGVDGAGTVPEGQQLQAERTSGAGTLDWDCLFLVPADEQQLQWVQTNLVGTTLDTLIDGVRNTVTSLDGATLPTAANPILWPTAVTVSGAFPAVSPGVTNRFYYLQAVSQSGAMTKGNTSSFTLYYWPSYLHVRPVTT
ncbi:hypothetical protein [Arthrobacter sp. Alg241-R88]|uniref:hypothetical protein n=1 Tax=Arthrobacter sp. Alg241-R88 TaxID=2305984 RepID=UPI0013D2466E|nr:hypothetical protein [Arthrobacter sp. Alg241-R88]